jgi:GT2 family glycosyltransferase
MDLRDKEVQGSMNYKNPLVSIIILNYNGKKFLKNCLKSVFKTDYDFFEVIFVDNSSTDGSFEFVQKNYKSESRLKIIRSEKNLGFGGGNNIGIKKAKGDFIVFLNNDTWVDPLWLEEIIKVIKKEPLVGACQSKLLLVEDSKRFDSAGDFVDQYGIMMRRGGDWGETDREQYDRVEEIFSARGAAMTIRRSVLKKIGLFDPDYFVTYEDIDICWRIRLGGYKVVYVPSSVVYHIGEASMPPNNPNKAYYITKNWISTLFKNYETRNLLKRLPFALVLAFGSFLAEIFIRHKYGHALNRLKGLLQAFFDFRKLWKKRLYVQNRIRKVPDSEIEYLMKKNLAFSYWLPLWIKARR